MTFPKKQKWVNSEKIMIKNWTLNVDSNSSLDGLKVLVFDDIDLADWDEALRCVESYEQQYTKKIADKKENKN